MLGSKSIKLFYTIQFLARRACDFYISNANIKIPNYISKANIEIPCYISKDNIKIRSSAGKE